MVVALLAKDGAPDMRVTLVEADRRKAEFLRTVSRETGVAVTVQDQRIEALPPLNADVVSARALAPLPVLCGYLERHMAAKGKALLLKGARAGEEVAMARQNWRFQLETLPSSTDPHGSILQLTDLHRV
jgi:16S rRNA (guanine527-N7)-methyltransferase